MTEICSPACGRTLAPRSSQFLIRTPLIATILSPAFSPAAAAGLRFWIWSIDVPGLNSPFPTMTMKNRM